MAKYILGKLQIKRLLDGKYVMDGRGRKFIIGDNIKEVLQKIDECDLYDKYEIFVENDGIYIREKV